MKDMDISIGILEERHIRAIVEATKGTNVDYLEMCIRENHEKKRVTLAAFIEDEFAGLVNLIFLSDYLYFKNNNIPEINDLLATPKYSHQGIGAKLIDEMEAYAKDTYKYIGLGVGLYKDYGAAHRLYSRKGYVPDGNGLMYNNLEAVPGSHVRVDNDLLLYLVKQLS
jgi:GNAT superfamily N-acetyltransferase